MRAVERLRVMSDSLLSLESVTLLLCVIMIVSSVFFSPEVMITLAITSVIAISAFLFFLSWLIFTLAKPDGLFAESKIKPKRRRMIERCALLVIFVPILLILGPLRSYPHPVWLAAVGASLFSAGILGKHYASKVKKREEEYPAFMRHIISNCVGGVPVITALKGIDYDEFKHIGKAIKRLYAKLRMRVEPKIAWWSFVVELDSRLIQRVNTVLIDSLNVGTLRRAGKIIEEFYSMYVMLRRRRYQVVSYLVNILVPLYAAIAGVFATIAGFFKALSSFMLQVATAIPFLSPPPIEFMDFFFVFTLLLLALADSLAVYSMEGDSRFTILYYLGLFLMIGGSIYYSLSEVTHHYLSSMAKL